MRRTACCLILLSLFACEDEGPDQEGEGPGPDVGVEADQEVREAPQDGAADAAPADAGVDGPPPHLEEPQGLVFPDDPITDEWTTSTVTLHETTTEDGALTSEWVQVFNCLNEDGGPVAMPDLGGFQITVQLCREVQVARPGPEGHYTHLEPPLLESDPNDSFAEVQMYHHVNVVHDYFKDTHGFDGLDFPLSATVNLQLKITPPISFGGFEPGPDGWYGLPNAAFFPKESWDQFASQFGLPPRPNDSIIFGQDDADFSYDARVIYHEYTHAVIGTERLQAAAVGDRWGLDNSPFSMNEGLADYFAGTVADGPEIGLYGIGALQPNLVRRLDAPRRCPDDLADEVHAQGRLVGSALWAVRDAVGAEVADQIVFNALEQFTVATTHDVAAELFLAEAGALGVEAEVRGVFEDFGFGGCVRSLQWVDFNIVTSRDQLPHVVEGRGSGGVVGFPKGVPGYKQFWFDAPAGVPGVALSWRVQGGGGALPGLGSSPRPLDLGLRHGAPIEFTYLGAVRMEHDAVVEAPLDGSAQAVTLSGGCLPEEGGRVHTLFLNPNDPGMNVVRMEIEVLDDLEGAPNVVDCAE